jgi:hypothetical protein
MRRGALIIAVLLAVVLASYFLFVSSHAVRSGSGASTPEFFASSNSASTASGTNAAAAAEVGSPTPQTAISTALPASSSAVAASHAGQLILDTNGVADLPAATVLANVRHAVRQFGQMFGGDPVGTNPEITRQLLGDNPRHINFIDPSAGMRVDANGELVDVWGTPYFFHQLSGSDMEIHSAGPDRIMWTADDLIVK